MSRHIADDKDIDNVFRGDKCKEEMPATKGCGVWQAWDCDIYSRG